MSNHVQKVTNITGKVDAGKGKLQVAMAAQSADPNQLVPVFNQCFVRGFLSVGSTAGQNPEALQSLLRGTRPRLQH